MTIPWKLYLGITAVFALGGVAGGLLGIHGERDRLRKFEHEGPGLLIDTLAKRLTHDLKLDPEQARRVREIFANTRPELMKMERERRRHIRELLKRTEPQLRQVFTGPQRERYEQLQQKMEKRLKLRSGEPPTAKKPPPAP